MSSTIVLITGANSGVGFATTKVIANTSEHFHVIMTGRSLEKVQSAMYEIKAAGVKGSLSVIQLDVIDEKSIEAAVKVVRNEHGRLDVLVNNAAIGRKDPDIKTRMQLSFTTNVIGPAMVTQAFRPLLLKSQKPYSIYVSSGVGSLAKAFETIPKTMRRDRDKDQYMPGEEAYRCSKTALNMLAVLEAKNFGPEGMKVFAMCPGFVVSNLRGTSEEARTGWGQAGDPEVSGKIILSIIQGERDEDAGKFVWKDGVYPW